MRLPFLSQVLSSLSKAKGHAAANRIATLFYCISGLLIILWLGDNHPVSQNSLANLGYHIIAFVMMLLLWGVLAFGGGAVLFRAIENRQHGLYLFFSP